MPENAITDKPTCNTEKPRSLVKSKEQSLQFCHFCLALVRVKVKRTMTITTMTTMTMTMTITMTITTLSANNEQDTKPARDPQTSSHDITAFVVENLPLVCCCHCYDGHYNDNKNTKRAFFLTTTQYCC